MAFGAIIVGVREREREAGEWGFGASLRQQPGPWLMVLRENMILVVYRLDRMQSIASKMRVSLVCRCVVAVKLACRSLKRARWSLPRATPLRGTHSTKQRETARDNVTKLKFRSDCEETVDNCQSIEITIRTPSKPRPHQAWPAYLKARPPQ
jgi:hypothetical protein